MRLFSFLFSFAQEEKKRVMMSTVFVDQIKDTGRKFDERDGTETGGNVDATGSKPRHLGKFMSSSVRTVL